MPHVLAIYQSQGSNGVCNFHTVLYTLYFVICLLALFVFYIYLFIYLYTFRLSLLIAARNCSRQLRESGTLGSIRLEMPQYFIIQLWGILSYNMLVVYLCYFGSIFVPFIIHYVIFCDLVQLPVGANDADLEERILQHFAAAAAMGRARHIARREGQRNRSSAQGRPQYLVFSAHPNSPPMAPASSSPPQRGDGEQTPATGEEPPQLTSVPPVQTDQVSASGSGSAALATDNQGLSYNSR